MGPKQHAQRFFVDGYSETWIPLALLWVLGTTIPIVELLAGALTCLGLRVRAAGVALGVVLVIVTYGHLLADPLFSLQAHIFPRLLLLLIVLYLPPESDLLSADAWLARRASGAASSGPPRVA